MSLDKNASLFTDVRRALIDRFECDERLGVNAVPMRWPVPQVAGSQAATSNQATDPRPSFSPVQDIHTQDFDDRRVRLNIINDREVMGCTKCGLAQTRTKTVFGVGSPAAKIVFVGEAPGHDEDKSGEPFVGRAGQLLNDMITKGMGLRREDVYICNVLKCRPPDNRTPAPDEIASCRGYLWRQIEIIQPELIVALGAPAAQTLLGTRESIGRLRGVFHEFYLSGSSQVGEPIPLLATYHPAYLLRTPEEKKKSWADLKLAMTKLGIPVPGR